MAGIKAFEDGCTKGSSIACANAGNGARYGIAQKIDLEKAYKLYARGCGLEEGWGCAGEAYFLTTGTAGVKQDAHGAIEKLRRACGNDTEVEVRSTSPALLESQKGDPAEISSLRVKGRARARTRAEDQQNAWAMYWLGTYERDGIGGVKDAKAARDHFARSCEKLDPLGCLTAGQTFCDGRRGRPRPRPRVLRARVRRARAGRLRRPEPARGVGRRGARDDAGGQPGRRAREGLRRLRGGAPDAGGMVVVMIAGVAVQGRRRRRTARR